MIMKKLSKLFFAFSIILLFNSCIRLKDSVVNEDEFLGDRKNSVSIYHDKADRKIINPFNINTDNWGVGSIKRLMLVEFEALFNYSSIELQVIEKDDTEGGLVILYFQDGSQADVYFTPNLSLSKDMYENVLNKTVLTKTDFQFNFEEIDGKLKVDLKLIDRFNNNIEMSIDEKYGDMEPVGLLAPIGGKADDPEFLTIVFMKHFKFLSDREDEINVRINDKEAELTTLPVKINGISGFQTKYSMQPVTVSWNKNYNDKLDLIEIDNGKNTFDNVIIDIKDNNGYKEISSYSGIQGKHEVKFRFAPAIPQLNKLKSDYELEGRFTMRVDDVQGIIAGEYYIDTNDGISLTIHPTDGYSPVPGTPWMTELTWQAKITKNDNSEYQMKSFWIKD
jgi:hypothetical protein